MGLRQRVLGGVARQLGRPEGWRGRLTARALNRANRAFVTAAVDATGVRAGQTAADVGFGGGVGLGILLDRVGATGRVHGVDLSTTMVSAARRRFADQVDAGTLEVATGSLVELPIADGSLDAAITVNTLYFVEDLRTAISELRRVLRPGGRLVIGIGDAEEMAKAPVTSYGFRLRPPEEVLAVMSEVGFTDPTCRTRGEGDSRTHLLVGGR